MTAEIDRGRKLSDDVMPPVKDIRPSLICAGILFMVCTGLNLFMSYGGIRTADGEIVFRTGQALAQTGSLALADDMAGWPGFAVATGVDGRLYSVFAPGQSILLVPLIRLGLVLDQTRWYQTRWFNVPVSFTVDADSLKDYFLGRRPADPGKHALRFIASFFNPVIAALAAVAFFFVIRYLTASTPAALATSLLLALATPLWSYSGTMFKEPLTMLWTLLSFYCLLRNDPAWGPAEKRYRRLSLAGLFLGLGFFTHTTVILFLPFFFLYGMYPYFMAAGAGNGQGSRIQAAFSFTAGFALFTAVFCWLNYIRFGNILQTGRSLSPVAYGPLVPPWEGLAGFLVSPGKGLLWFCPMVLAGIFWWPRFHRTHRALSLILLAAIAFRWVFLSCFGDWHGGFCLGPRHLLPVAPFFLIPVAFSLAGWSSPDGRPTIRRRGLLTLFFFVCVLQQVYFCLGEPISFYYLIKQFCLARGVSIIASNQIYFQWRASPLFFLLEADRGPFLLRHLPLSNYGLWLLIDMLMAPLFIAVIRVFQAGILNERRPEKN